ncbi:glycine-rich cell wall structural-like [Prunus dulcis]|uniref:Glycine-rich cell wall structural-like n=1 Tax=Prunus dulcis TaxID=3755 RepID=A0A5E4G5U2_PRUDU|nr:glycine-rich cell wall structural-like [Prunus dulcis]
MAAGACWVGGEANVEDGEAGGPREVGRSWSAGHGPGDWLRRGPEEMLESRRGDGLGSISGPGGRLGQGGLARGEESREGVGPELMGAGASSGLELEGADGGDGFRGASSRPKEKVIGGVKFEKVGGVRAGKRGGHEDQKERRVDFSGRMERLIPCE